MHLCVRPFFYSCLQRLLKKRYLTVKPRMVWNSWSFFRHPGDRITRVQVTLKVPLWFLKRHELKNKKAWCVVLIWLVLAFLAPTAGLCQALSTSHHSWAVRQRKGKEQQAGSLGDGQSACWRLVNTDQEEDISQPASPRGGGSGIPSHCENRGPVFETCLLPTPFSNYTNMWGWEWRDRKPGVCVLLICAVPSSSKTFGPQRKSYDVVLALLFCHLTLKSR